MAVRSNRLLNALSSDSRQQILLVARNLELPQHTTLFQPDQKPGFVYFLTSGIASMVVTAPEGGSAEIGMIGTEGIVGGFHLLGQQLPVSQCVMQVSGSALRVPMVEMRRFFAESEDIRSLVHQSLLQQALTLGQIAGCNKLHQATERLARWLLTAADRLGSETVGLTQEAVSQMLGTRRTTVALVAGELQRASMIQYRRGTVHITNRERLEEAACDCYKVTRRLVDDLYPTPATPTLA